MKVKVVLSCLALSLVFGPTSQASIFDDDVRKDINAFEKRIDSAFEKHKRSFSRKSSLEEEMSKILKRIRKRSDDVARKARRMRKKIKKKGLTAADKDIDKIDDLFEDLQDQKDMFNKLVEKADAFADYNVVVKDTKKETSITISLPGYNKKDLNNNIEITKALDSKGNIIGKNLIISVYKESKKEKGKKVYKKEIFSSSKTIDGKKQKISYSIEEKNGNLTVSINLPATIPTSDYTMKFKDDTLAITFLKKEKTEQRKKLKFTE